MFLALADAAKDADVIIEAVIERMDLKKSLYTQLDGIVKESTILASNTSALSVTEMAVVTSRPERFIGMHFFNPVPVMKLVEVIRGIATSDETVAIIKDLSKKMGKTAIEVKEAPGFVVNRILVPMITEAIFVLQEGLATKEEIDEGMKLAPITPLLLVGFGRSRGLGHYAACPAAFVRGVRGFQIQTPHSSQAACQSRTPRS